MKLAPIGVGQAGGKLVDQLASHDAETDLGFVVDALAVNSARADLVALRHLPKERRVLIGQAATDGHGVGGDNQQGAHVMNDDIADVLYRLEEANLDDADAFLLAAGLGGGMGSGGTPVLAKYLQDRYDKPVYAIGILPASSEGHLTALNTMQSLITLVHHTENIILFDNEDWKIDDEPLSASYQSMNDQLVVHLAAVFGATEPLSGDDVGEQVVDAADVRETLNAADLSVIGYSDTELERENQGFLEGLLGGDPDYVVDDIADELTTLVQEATLGRLTAPAPLTDVQNALVLLAGASDCLARGGLDAATEWLDAETNGAHIRAGDYPVEDGDTGDYAAGIVLLSGLPVVERLIELYDRVIGLDQIPGLSGSEVEATEVMESFFTDENGPSPLFTTDAYDPDALTIANLDENAGSAETATTDEGDFDWRDISSDNLDTADSDEDDDTDDLYDVGTVEVDPHDPDD